MKIIKGQRYLYDNVDKKNHQDRIDAKFILEIIKLQKDEDHVRGKIIKIFKKDYWEEGFESDNWFIPRDKEIWTHLKNQEKPEFC